MNEIAATARRAAAMRDRIALAAIVALLVVLSATNGSADSSSPDRAFDFGAAWLLALATGLAFLGRRAPTIGALGNLVVIVVWYRIGYGSAIVNAPYLVAFYLLGARYQDPAFVWYQDRLPTDRAAEGWPNEALALIWRPVAQL